MKNYIVAIHTGVELKSGKVRLTKEQAARRAARLAPVKDQPGVYEILAPTMFKRGEKFGYDGSINKVQMTELIDEAKAEEAAKKAEEIAKAGKGKK